MFGAGVIFVSVGCVSSVDVSEDPEKKQYMWRTFSNCLLGKSATSTRSQS